MHMADALLSPAVGGTMWAVSAGTIAYCSSKIRAERDDRKVPLMGVLGAFLFAAQMINFTIPATGSSGHLSGGLLLAILLGPYAAFLTIASVLVVQALFFADGGLLALGCNIFNMGFLTAFVAYPLFYKPIAGAQTTPSRTTMAAIVSGVIGLQLGAFAVVLETVASGISALSFTTFATLMQSIHLGIGIVEGFVSATIVAFVYKARPELILNARHAQPSSGLPLRSLIVTFLALALVTGGFVSRFASANPDGLEWAIKKSTGTDELNTAKAGIHGALAALQEKLAFLPDYNFKKPVVKQEGTAATAISKAANSDVTVRTEAESKKDGSALGTSLAGLIGGIITLGLACAVGAVLRRFSIPQPN